MPLPIAKPAASPFRTKDQRETERSNKREAVLRAAVRMFNERGFYATSLDDVAASLVITKPTIYHYLGNKENVLLECVRRGLEQVLQAAEAARSSPGDGLDRLRIFLCSYAEISMADFGRCVIRTGDEVLSTASRTRLRKLKKDIDNAMRDLIVEGIADRSIAKGDVRMIAFTLAGALNWPARWQDPKGAETPKALARALVDILTLGLRPR